MPEKEIFPSEREKRIPGGGEPRTQNPRVRLGDEGCKKDSAEVLSQLQLTEMGGDDLGRKKQNSSTGKGAGEPASGEKGEETG